MIVAPLINLNGSSVGFSPFVPHCREGGDVWYDELCPLPPSRDLCMLMMGATGVAVFALCHSSRLHYMVTPVLSHSFENVKCYAPCSVTAGVSSVF